MTEETRVEVRWMKWRATRGRPYSADVAVRGEDYTEAARLRDRLAALKGSSAAGVTAGDSGNGNECPGLGGGCGEW